MKKGKFKKFFKKHGLKLGIGSLVFLLVGIGFFFLGAYLAGWDILGWFSTPSAILVYIFVGGFLLLAIFLIVSNLLQKEANGNE